MDDSKISMGDLVVLKSGGPIMTAGREVQSKMTECLWYEYGDDRGLKNAIVPTGALRHATEQERQEILGL